MRKALAVVLALAAAPVLAQQPPSQGGGDILAMVGAGAFDDARAALNARPHTVVDILFLEAQIRTRQGDYENAARIYRAILRVDPGNIPVRQALADTLYQAEDWDAAIFHFDELMKVDPREEAKAFYQEAISAIQRRKPYGVTASVSLTPSTNINSGTTTVAVQDGQLTLRADEFGIKESGLGLNITTEGFYRVPRETGMLTFRLGGSGSFYSNDVYNVLVPYASVDFTRRSGPKEVRLGANVSRTLRETQPDTTSSAFTDVWARSVNLSFSNQITPRTRNFVDFTVERLTYDDAPASDGTGFYREMGLIHALDATTSLVGAFRVGFYGGAQDYTSWKRVGLRVGLNKVWKGGWATYGSVQYDRQEYGLLPFSNDPRLDDDWLVQGTILNSRISYNGFAPRLSCSWRKTASSIDIYDAETTECTVQITRGF